MHNFNSSSSSSPLFKRYFSNAPTIDVPGRLFPVQEFLLEDIVEELKYRPKEVSGRQRNNQAERQRLKSLTESHGGGVEGKNKARDQLAKEQKAQDEYWEAKLWAQNPLGGQMDVGSR